jgi:hypothetical protein
MRLMSPRQRDRRLDAPNPPCMVRNCSSEADEVWTAHSGFAQWVVHWDVCPRHGELLGAEEAWAADYGQAPSWRRRIVMGDDLRNQPGRPSDSAVVSPE